MLNKAVEITKPKKGYLIGSFFFVLLSYIFALGGATGVIFLLKNHINIILLTLIADIYATIVIYIFSMIFRNISFYDPYWSVIPIGIVFFWLFNEDGLNGYLIRQIIVAALVTLWGIRLTMNWAISWKGLKHEDWRYVKYREEKPKIFWFIAFIGLELMPTFAVFSASLSFYPAISSIEKFNFLDIFGIVITLGAIIIETIADEQMRCFSKKIEKGKVVSKGLWAVSRHPNYFGEISFWWGIYFFGLAADRTYWWTVFGPFLILCLFIFISIPLSEKHHIEKRKEYLDYKKKVSMLVPWLPKKQVEK